MDEHWSSGASRPAACTSARRIYDPTVNQWTLTGPMAANRIQHALALLTDGRVLVTGGFAGGYTAQAELSRSFLEHMVLGGARCRPPAATTP